MSESAFLLGDAESFPSCVGPRRLREVGVELKGAMCDPVGCDDSFFTFWRGLADEALAHLSETAFHLWVVDLAEAFLEALIDDICWNAESFFGSGGPDGGGEVGVELKGNNCDPVG